MMLLRNREGAHGGQRPESFDGTSNTAERQGNLPIEEESRDTELSRQMPTCVVRATLVPGLGRVGKRLRTKQQTRVTNA